MAKPEVDTVLAVVIVAIVAIFTLFFGLSDSEPENGTAIKEARFEKVEEFKMFEDDNLESGYIIRDKRSGKCYFWVRRGTGKSMTDADCPTITPE